MKRCVSLILLIVIAMNTALPVLGFTFAQKAARKQMKRFILGKVPDDKLEIIKIPVSALNNGTSGLQFIHEGEFRYHNKMYDIVRKGVKADTVSYYVVNDVLEEKLIENFSTYIKDNFGNELNRMKANLSKVFKLFAFDYCPDSPAKEFVQKNKPEETKVVKGNICIIYLDIPTPPPKV